MTENRTATPEALSAVEITEWTSRPEAAHDGVPRRGRPTVTTNVDLVVPGRELRAGASRFDPDGLQALSREECLRLLASAPIGRIVFTERAMPAIRPVNFVVDGETVVFRTSPGLIAATDRTVVAFEADNIDVDSHTGWSVTAIGHAARVIEPAELARLLALPHRLWLPGQRNAVIRIAAEVITVRRLIDDPGASLAVASAPASVPVGRR